jgi:tetratricopeptide (TPR) repeat protein
MIVIDSSQSMVGERSARARALVQRLVEQLDRRDRFSALACDSACRGLGPLRSPSVAAAAALGAWLDAQPAAGASDVVASIRAAAAALPDADRERWVIVIGDGFASTGFRRAGDVAAAIADTTRGINVSTIGIGSDADSAVLAAAARGGGGSYVAWVPGQSVQAAALASLEATLAPALRDATITLPDGLADVAPGALPTIRSGEEVLIAARLSGPVHGDVILKGTVAGQPFEQRYPLALAVSIAPGNGFVPRLWATLAIAQLEQHGAGEDRARIVALSQAYGVMSKETSLLVLESAAMFDAFGVDRTVPAAKWTGEAALDEVTASGARPVGHPPATGGAAASKAAGAMAAPRAASRGGRDDDDGGGGGGGDFNGLAGRGDAPMAGAWDERDRGAGQFAMRRTWVRVPALSAYDGVSAGIAKAIANGERALVRSPDSREAHRALVQALSYAGELDRADQLAARWLDRDRLDPLALGYQADLLGRAGQRELALRMLAGVVDLDPDRVEAQERLAAAYARIGRAPEACSHRIALSTIAPTDARAGAAAVRCLRALGRDRDAALIVRGLADDATRAAADQALAAAPAAIGKRDVVIAARWDGGDDLDLSLVTPDGTRVSWMGGRPDLEVDDATSTAQEELALAAIKRGNYLVEIGRGGPGRATVHGTIDVTVLGAKQAFRFELAPAQPRVTVARLAVSLEERLESIGAGAVTIAFGAIPNPAARRVMLARSPELRRCLEGASVASGRITLTITVDEQGGTVTRAGASRELARAAACAVQSLEYMHVEGTPAGTFRVPVSFTVR